MIILANKEVYRLDIKVGVTGDSEAKSKLTATEKMAEQTQKKLKALDKINVSPSAKLNDQASSKLDKLESKVSKLKSENVAVTAKIKDEITPATEKIQKKTDKLKDSNPTVKVKVKDEASATLGKIDKKISSWLKIGAKKVIAVGVAGSLALGGLGVGNAIKTFTSFEQGLSNVKAVTDATDVQMKQLSDTAKKLGADTAWSASAVTDAEQLLGQAGYSVDETMTALPGLLSLASAGSLDLSAATSIASSTLRGFNLDVSQTAHVADVLALTANATNSDVTDLGESLKYISPVANALGISMEDAVAATGLLSNQAIVGSQAGTVLRQTMARLASPTKEASKIMKKYGVNAFDAQGNMKPLSAVIDNLNSSLGKLTSQQRADVISTIFGTESMSGVMALMNQGGQSLSDLSTKLVGAKGAADKMAETKLDNLAGQWEQLSGAAETMQINLGERLAPYAKQFVTWLTDKMPIIESKVVSIVDYISNNVGTVKAMAGAVIAVGGAFAGLSIAGKVASSVTAVKTLLGLTTAVTTATTVAGAGASATGVGAAAGGFAKLTASLKSSALVAKILPAIFSPAGLAVATVGVTAGLVAYGLSQDVVPKVDLFADGVEQSMGRVTNSMGNTTNAITQTPVKISEATKKNVGAYMDMDNKVQKSLLNMKYTNATITGDIAKDLTTTFSTMGQTVTTKLDKDLADSSSKIEKLLKGSDIRGTDQTDIMTQIQNHYNNQKTATQNATDEINNILSTAAANGGKITSDQYARMAELNNQMTTTAVTALSDNEKESAVILGRIKNQSTRITAETASDVVTQLENQRVKTIDAANVEYAERVKIAEAIRSEGGAKAEETANKIIEEAGRQRDEVIKGANDTKSQGIDVLKESYTGLGTEVSDQTGKILNWWDRLKAWWGSNSFPTKTATIDVTQNVTAGGTGGTNFVTDKPTGDVKQYNSPDRTKNMSTGGYATGTENATAGIHPVAENGYEILVGRQNKMFNGGEKVLNHEQSKAFLQNQQSNETFQVKQGQYQVFQPQQVQVDGGSGNNIKVNVQVNSNSDVDEIVQEAVQLVGYKLKEALTNIKK